MVYLQNLRRGFGTSLKLSGGFEGRLEDELWLGERVEMTKKVKYVARGVKLKLSVKVREERERGEDQAEASDWNCYVSVETVILHNKSLPDQEFIRFVAARIIKRDYIMQRYRNDVSVVFLV